MSSNLLVVNVGSSSLKLVLLDDADAEIATKSVDGHELDLHTEISRFVDGIPEIHSIGHRVAHGGADMVGPVDLSDESVRSAIAALSELAPLHNPASLRGIEITAKLLPGVPAFACFDTAFHHTLPEAARTFALPAEWNQRWDLRRFGFHGLSHAYCARRTAELVSTELGALRLVSAHLGAGCSLAAVKSGISVDTTMGFTPIDGVVMATRSGAIDPGLLLWLLRHARISPEEAETELEKKSGLLGLSGLSSDLRDLESASDSGHQGARLAIDVFVQSVSKGIAAMATVMGGIDVLAFTGGVGQNSERISRLK